MTVSRQLQSFWIDMNFTYITVYLVSETHGVCTEQCTWKREKTEKGDLAAKKNGLKR